MHKWLFPILFLFAFSLHGQETSPLDQFLPKEQRAVPNPVDLTPDWWLYLDAPQGEYQQRATEMIDQLEVAILRLPPRERVEAQALVQRISNYLQALPQAQAAALHQYPPLPVVREKYTLQQLFSLSRKKRKVTKTLEAEQDDLTYYAKATQSLDRHYNLLVSHYLTLTKPTKEKLLLGLELIGYRLAWEVAQEEQRHARERVAFFSTQLKNLELEISEANRRLDTTNLHPTELEEQLQQAEAHQAATQQMVVDAEAESLSLFADTPTERAMANLLFLRAEHAAANDAIARLHVIQLAAMRALALYVRDQYPGPDIVLQERLRQWKRQITRLAAAASEWDEDTDWELKQAGLAVAALVGEEGQEATELRRIHRLRQREAQEMLNLLLHVDEALASTRIVLNEIQLEIRQRASWWERTWGSIVDGFFAIWPTIVSWLNFSFFTVGGVPFTLWSAIRVFLILLIAWWISKLINGVIRWFCHWRYGQERPGLYTTGRLLHYFILVIAILYCLALIGVNFNRLIIILGALSVGIGFGLQGMVVNLVGGLALLFERHVKVGDVIELETGQVGKVSGIHMQNSTMRTPDGVDVIIPNSQLVSSRLINWTMQDPYRRVHVPFIVASDSDKEQVRKVVTHAARALPSTVTEHPPLADPEVRLLSIGGYALEFELVAWVSLESYKHYNALLATYRWEIESALRKANIEIPFPQQDIHIKDYCNLREQHEG